MYKLRTLWLALCFFGLSTIDYAQQLQYVLIGKPIIIERVKESLPSNEERERKVKDLFKEAGCGSEITEQPVKHVYTPNVICRLQGESDEQIIVGAHYDKVRVGTGTIDNWSGAALLPSLYQGLASRKRHYTFLFVAFTGEEDGLIGSDYFVNHMSKDEVARTKAMVNMDTLGLSFTKVWVHNADQNLLHALLAVSGSLKLPVGEVDVESIGSTDSESFADKHIPRITIHSLTRQTLSILHSPADAFQALHPDEYFDTYQLLQAYIAYLDIRLQAGSPVIAKEH